jgi:hypothetical protein
MKLNFPVMVELISIKSICGKHVNGLKNSLKMFRAHENMGVDTIIILNVINIGRDIYEIQISGNSGTNLHKTIMVNMRIV